MITETVIVNEQGQITLPAWFFEQIGVRQGLPLTINFDESTKQFSLLLSTNDEQPKDKKSFKSGFGMVKTNIQVDDTDFDVSVFAKDVL